MFLERIVMTPKKKTATSTTLKMERKLIQVENTPASTSNGSTNTNGASMTPGRKESLHIAGGKNAGIVVNKEIEKDGKNSNLFLTKLLLKMFNLLLVSCLSFI